MIPLWGGIYKCIEMHKFTKQKHTPTQKLTVTRGGRVLERGKLAHGINI